MMGFEVGDTFKTMEVLTGGAMGSGVTLVASPAPWPTNESGVAQLDQGLVGTIQGNYITSVTEGEVFAASFYVYFSKVGSWPAVLDILIFRFVDSTPSPHFQLNLTSNAGKMDMELQDRSGTTKATITGAIEFEDRWYRVDVLAKLHNTDGRAKVRVVDKTDNSVTGTGSISSGTVDTWTANSVGVYLQGEGGASPLGSPTTTYIGSCVMFNGGDDPIDDTQWIGDYTIFGEQPNKVNNTPDWPSGAPDLDVGTWSKAGDGATGVGNRAIYDWAFTAPLGGERLDHPRTDARIDAAAILYAAEWLAKQSGDTEFQYGRRTNGSSYDYTAGGTLANFRVILTSGSYFPRLLTDNALIGFKNDSTFMVQGEARLEEAWYYSCMSIPSGIVPYPRPRGLRGGMHALAGGMH